MARYPIALDLRVDHWCWDPDPNRSLIRSSKSRQVAQLGCSRVCNPPLKHCHCKPESKTFTDWNAFMPDFDASSMIEKVILVNAFWVIVITNNTKQALYTIRVLYDVVGDIMLLDATLRQPVGTIRSFELYLVERYDRHANIFCLNPDLNPLPEPWKLLFWIVVPSVNH